MLIPYLPCKSNSLHKYSKYVEIWHPLKELALDARTAAESKVISKGNPEDFGSNAKSDV